MASRSTRSQQRKGPKHNDKPASTKPARELNPNRPPSSPPPKGTTKPGPDRASPDGPAKRGPGRPIVPVVSETEPLCFDRLFLAHEGKRIVIARPFRTGNVCPGGQPLTVESGRLLYWLAERAAAVNEPGVAEQCLDEVKLARLMSKVPPPVVEETEPVDDSGRPVAEETEPVKVPGPRGPHRSKVHRLKYDLGALWLLRHELAEGKPLIGLLAGLTAKQRREALALGNTLIRFRRGQAGERGWYLAIVGSSVVVTPYYGPPRRSRGRG